MAALRRQRDELTPGFARPAPDPMIGVAMLLDRRDRLGIRRA
jgi:hypothetical protein